MYNVVLVSAVKWSESVIATLLDFSPVLVITEYWVELPVLYSRFLLVICFMVA